MYKTKLIFSFFALTIFLSSCTTLSDDDVKKIMDYTPVDKELFDVILQMDKEFFDAYNSCDLDKQSEIYSDNLEFFHDKGGLVTSKDEILKATEMNICDKVSRTLIDGSVEVYPIKDYGAVQMGMHKFFNIEEPDAESIPVKFIMIWKNNAGHWKIEKVISLHS